MPLTVNLDTYTNDVARTPDSYRYLGPIHSAIVNDFIDLSRTAAKPTTDYAGKGRARLKLTRDATDGTASLGDAICDIQISFPVGMQLSEQTALITDIATYLGTTSADDLFSVHKINQ